MSEPGGDAAAMADVSVASGNGAGPQRMRLGGMALRNGLLIHGPTSWAAAARASDGSIRVASGAKPSFAGSAGGVPLLRGPLKLAEALAVVPLARRRLPEARLPFEDSRVLLAALAVTVAGGALRRGEASSPARESIAAALGLLPAAVALRGSELAAYHGVEHKAIGAYEQGRSDPAAVAKEHERCGSHLIAPLLVLSVAVELFAWCERNPDSSITRLVRRPGTEIQRLFATREPTPDQLEVGSAALDAILRAEGASPAVPATAAAD